MSQSIDQEFPDRKEWRKWLEENHSSEKEVWVIIHKKKSGKRKMDIKKRASNSQQAPIRTYPQRARA